LGLGAEAQGIGQLGLEGKLGTDSTGGHHCPQYVKILPALSGKIIVVPDRNSRGNSVLDTGNWSMEHIAGHLG